MKRRLARVSPKARKLQRLTAVLRPFDAGFGEPVEGGLVGYVEVDTVLQDGLHGAVLGGVVGRLDFDSPCLAEAEYRRRGNGIIGAGAVVPAKRTSGKVGSKLPLGPGHSTRVNTSGSTARRGHPTRDLGAKPQLNTPPAK